MQAEFVTSISEMTLATKCFTSSEIIHEFCLRFAMVTDFVPSQGVVISWYCLP